LEGRLKGRVAFISGAGSGIAKASAQTFAREGAKLVLADIDAELGEATLQTIIESGGESIFVRTDVTDEASVAAALTAGADRFGNIDVLVNCAGGSVPEDAPVTDVDMDVWRSTIDLDLKGPFLCCRCGIPYLKAAGGGSIVNFTSVVALRGSFAGHVYTAAKGGIISFTQALAGRYWRDNIRANAVAPGIVLSDRVRSRFDIAPDTPAEDQIAAAMAVPSWLVDDRHPFGYGMPEDIANIVLFLASDESRMVNGAVIPAEGGASAY
jgi:NAD(P)-dependent dehydrogenase (short-subunit alcohol dehydrogenase family)